MNKVFEVQEITDEQVILKVNAKDPLTVAQHPYLDATMAYITVTKGDNHILTVIKEDGSRGVSFHWGLGGYTLISKNLTRLQDKVREFILRERVTAMGSYF